MKPTAAMEDYLEAILFLQKNGIETRVKNIAEELRIKPPSVIEMLKSLSAKGFILHEERNKIELTTAGREIAEMIQRRHKYIKKFFKDVLGMNEQIADEDACKVEHCLSANTCNRFIEYVQFLEKQDGSGTDWLN